MNLTFNCWNHSNNDNNELNDDTCLTQFMYNRYPSFCYSWSTMTIMIMIIIYICIYKCITNWLYYDLIECRELRTANEHHDAAQASLPEQLVNKPSVSYNLRLSQYHIWMEEHRSNISRIISEFFFLYLLWTHMPHTYHAFCTHRNPLL